MMGPVIITRGVVGILAGIMLALQEYLKDQYGSKRTEHAFFWYVGVLGLSMVMLGAGLAAVLTIAGVQCHKGGIHGAEWCEAMFAAEFWAIAGVFYLAVRRWILVMPMWRILNRMLVHFRKCPIVLGRHWMHYGNPPKPPKPPPDQTHSTGVHQVCIRCPSGVHSVNSTGAHQVSNQDNIDKPDWPLELRFTTSIDYIGQRAIRELLGISDPIDNQLELVFAGWMFVGILCTARGPEPFMYLKDLSLKIDFEYAYQKTHLIKWGQHIRGAQRWLAANLELEQNTFHAMAFLMAVFIQKQRLAAPGAEEYTALRGKFVGRLENLKHSTPATRPVPATFVQILRGPVVANLPEVPEVDKDKEVLDIVCAGIMQWLEGEPNTG